jgi:hypothetical protein
MEVDNVSKLSLLVELDEDGRHVIHTILRTGAILTDQLVQQVF